MFSVIFLIHPFHDAQMSEMKFGDAVMRMRDSKKAQGVQILHNPGRILFKIDPSQAADAKTSFHVKA